MHLRIFMLSVDVCVMWKLGTSQIENEIIYLMTLRVQSTIVSTQCFNIRFDGCWLCYHWISMRWRLWFEQRRCRCTKHIAVILVFAIYAVDFAVLVRKRMMLVSSFDWFFQTAQKSRRDGKICDILLNCIFKFCSYNNLYTWFDFRLLVNGPIFDLT